LHTERDRGVVEPPSPGAAAIFSSGYWHDVFLLATIHLLVFSAILGKPRYRGRSGRWQIKRVVQDQIERSPRGHFARAYFAKVREPTTPGLIKLCYLCKTNFVVSFLPGQ